MYRDPRTNPKVKQEILDTITQERPKGVKVPIEEALERRNYSKKLLDDRRDELRQMIDNIYEFY